MQQMINPPHISKDKTTLLHESSLGSNISLFDENAEGAKHN